MVLRWIPDGPDEEVSVSCYTSGTDPTDTFFTANFAAGNQPGAVYSYLWADQPTSTGRYTPSRQYRHDSTGQDSWIARESTGRYRVYLPAAAGAGTGPLVYQVTAYGAATFQCKVSATSVPGATLEVSCRDVLGTLFDTRFALSFSAVGSLFGRTDRRTGTTAAVTRAGAGVYRAVVPGLGQDRGQVVVNATGAGPTWCHADRWDPTGPDLAVLVRCYGPRGAAVDSTFSLGVSW
jgi:hypothetical protein